MASEEREIKLAPEYWQPFLELSKSTFSELSHRMITDALTLAAEKLDGLTRHDGTPLVLHSLNTASIVIQEIGLGRNSTISTLLHDVVRLGLMEASEVGKRYGDACIGILQGLCNISDVDTKEPV